LGLPDGDALAQQHRAGPHLGRFIHQRWG